MGVLLDAFYFDYKRRNDPEFRKALKRDKKRHARSQKAQVEAAHAEQRRMLVVAVREAQMEGFPADVEEKEAYFMNEVAQGEGLCQEGEGGESVRVLRGEVRANMDVGWGV